MRIDGVPAWRALAIVAADYGICANLIDEKTVVMRECRGSDVAPAADEFEYRWEPSAPDIEDYGAT